MIQLRSSACERRRARLPLFALGALVLAVAVPLVAQAGSVQREQFRRAYQAYRDGKFTQAATLGRGLEDYLLYPYLRYESLSHELEVGKDPVVEMVAIRGFLKTYADTNVGEKLRREWLLRLARAGQWHAFLDDYTPQSSIALRCAHISARIATDASNANEAALKTEAIEIWTTGKSLPSTCSGIDDWLARRGVLTHELIRQRLDLALAESNTALAAQLAGHLPESNAALLKLWPKVLDKPSKGLTDPLLKPDNTLTRAILRSGIERLAKANAIKADGEWMQRRGKYHFSEAESAAVAANIAIAAAHQERIEAPRLLDKIPDSIVRADVQRAKLVTALERSDWQRLEQWTRQQPADDMEKLSWRYWRARALQKLNMRADAEQIFRELAEERDYYGLLAAEHLKQSYRFAHMPTAANQQQIDAFLKRPGIVRAQELRDLGFDAAAREEWNFEIDKMERNELLVAAAAAHSVQWHERAIATLGKAKVYDDLDIRYPVAFQTLVEQYARQRGLEPAVMLSFIRSESAFNELARSPAGALGLMQVMPATGRRTAKGLGLAHFSSGDLLKPMDNVMIGSAYLRDMLDLFDGNLAMAAAAYNAGPQRVDQWRPPHNCVDADIWVDTIPFTETRRYARNILFGTALYQMRLKEEIKPISERVAVVHAENVNAGSCNTG